MGIFSRLYHRILGIPEYEIYTFSYDDEETLYGYQPRMITGRDTTESGVSFKAKKGKRKPLPAKIREKIKEKKEKQKIQKEKRAKQLKDDVQICKVDGQKYVKRRPIPDDPAYEGVYRTLWEDMPEADQDRQDMNYVNAVVSEMHWLLDDEEQMKPIYETLTQKEYEQLAIKNADDEYYAICKGHRNWVNVLEIYGDERIAEVFAESREDQEDYPVPWIGGNIPDPKKKPSKAKNNDKEAEKMKATVETVNEDESSDDANTNGDSGR